MKKLLVVSSRSKYLNGYEALSKWWNIEVSTPDVERILYLCHQTTPDAILFLDLEDCLVETVSSSVLAEKRYGRKDLAIAGVLDRWPNVPKSSEAINSSLNGSLIDLILPTNPFLAAKLPSHSVKDVPSVVHLGTNPFALDLGLPEDWAFGGQDGTTLKIAFPEGVGHYSGYDKLLYAIVGAGDALQRAGITDIKVHVLAEAALPVDIAVPPSSSINVSVESSTLENLTSCSTAIITNHEFTDSTLLTTLARAGLVIAAPDTPFFRYYLPRSRLFYSGILSSDSTLFSMQVASGQLASIFLGSGNDEGANTDLEAEKSCLILSNSSPHAKLAALSTVSSALSMACIVKKYS